MDKHGLVRPAGELKMNVERRVDLTYKPQYGSKILWQMVNTLKHRRRAFPKNIALTLVGRLPGVITLQSELSGRVYRKPVDLAVERLSRLNELLGQNIDVRELPRLFGGQVFDYGVLSTRVVTDAGVAFIVDAFQNTTELENLKYHGYGTGSTAESAAQTALVTELTTEYASDNVRPTGSTTEGASANIYRTVATLSPDSGGTIAVTEHGIFSQAAVAGGTMLDRSVFSAVNLVAGSDSLQTTYDLTMASGG